jgi:hypothetical protein
VYSIAAASIIAKVTRDRIINTYHTTYPIYNFAQHKGYPTLSHRTILYTHGPCDIHRKTFGPVRDSILKLTQKVAHVSHSKVKSISKKSAPKRNKRNREQMDLTGCEEKSDHKNKMKAKSNGSILSQETGISKTKALDMVKTVKQTLRRSPRNHH